LALLLAINLFNYLDRYILSAVLPEVKREFGCSEAEAGWSASIFLLSYMIVSPIFGWLGDRMSRWWLAGIGVIVWSLASGGTGLAPTFMVLLWTRALIGIGEGAYGPVAPTIISDLYPVEKRGSKLAWFYVAIPVGSALGVALGGTLAKHFGWRWAFYAVVPPGIILGLLCFFMKEAPRAHLQGEHRPARWKDYLGLTKIPSFVCCTLGMTALTFALGGTAIWLPTYYYERELMYQITPTTLQKLDGVVPADVIERLQSMQKKSFRGESSFRRGLAEHLTPDEIWKYRGNIVQWSHDPDPAKLEHIALVFGAILCSSGLGATLAGGWLGDKLRPRFPGSYFLVSGGGMLIGFPAFIGAITFPMPWCWPFAFVAVFFLMFNTGPANTILANVTHPAVRSMAFGVNIFIIHILGDVPSPIIVGWIHDHIGLRQGMFLLSAATLVSGLIWLWGAQYLEKDTRRVEEATRNRVA
jgi:MFS family permease